MAGLELGSVYTKLGATLDDDAFNRYDRRIDAAERKARGGVETKLKADADTRGFDAYDRKVRDVNRSHDDLVRGSGRVKGAMGSLFIGGAGVAAAGVGFGLLAKGAMGAVGAFQESEKIAKRTANVLKTTGGVAGVTAKQVADLAGSISAKTGIDDEAIQSSENLLLTFTNVRNEVGKGNDIFNQATKTVADMSAALGQDTSSSAIQLGKALNDPIKGVSALSRVGVSFTAQQKEQIKTLVESGKSVDAQKIILGELSKEFGGAGEAGATNTAKLKVAFGNLQETVGGALAPAFEKAAGAATSFIEGMQSGEGSGGVFLDRVKAGADGARQGLEWLKRAGEDAFTWLKENKDAQAILGNIKTVIGLVVDTVKDFGKTAGRVFKDIGPDLETIGKALLKVQAIFTGELVAVIKRELPGIKKLFEGFANVVRGIVKVIASLLRGDLGGAFDGLKQIVKGAFDGVLGLIRAATAPFRQVASRVWQGVTAGASAAFDAATGIVKSGVRTIVGGFSSLLGIVADVVNVGSKLPGIGGKFKGVADAIRNTQRRIDDYRDSLKETRKEHDRSGASVDDLRDRQDRLRARLSTLRKGTADYRTTAGELRKTQRALNDAMSDAKAAGDKGSKGIKGIGTSAFGASGTVADAAQGIADNVSGLAKSLGAPVLKFTAKRAKSGIGDAAQAVADLGFGKATGGIPNPGSGRRDDHLLLAPDGRPVAALSGTEGILNDPQMAEVDASLAMTKALGLGRFGGLGELWGSGMRHFAAGGAIGPVPGFPGEEAATRVIPAITAIVRKFGVRLTDAFDRDHSAGHKSPGHNVTGTAADFAGSDSAMDAAVAYLTGKGYTVGYDGRFGSMRWPGHGPSSVAGANAHLHVELGGKGAAIDGASAAAPTLKDPVITGPAGALLNIIRGAGRRMTKGANAFLGKLAPATTATGPDGTAGSYSKAALMALWRKAGGNAGSANIAAAIALAESGGDPNAGRSHPYHGLWQIGPGGPWDPLANAKEAVRKSGNGRNWTPWTTYTGYDTPGHEKTYLRYLAGGGRLARFAGGGKLARGKPTVVGSESQGANVGRLRDVQGPRIRNYDAFIGKAERGEKDYSYFDRRYDQSDEELIDPDTGEVNVAMVNKRVGELAHLYTIRDNSVGYYSQAKTIGGRVVKTYRTILTRLRKARASIRGNKTFKRQRRDYYDRRIKAYSEDLDSWEAKLPELADTLRDAKLDRTDTFKELESVRGTKAEPKEPDTADTTAEPDTSPIADSSSGDASSSTDTSTPPAEAAPAPPTAEDIAAGVAAALATFNQGRADLFGAFGSNLMRPDRALGLGGALGQAAGTRFFGAASGAGATGVRDQAGGLTVQQDIHFSGPQPPDPHTFTQAALHELKAAV